VLFFVSRRLLRPVRRLAHDARRFSPQATNGHAASFEDDVRELEFYSRAIMSDATRTRVSLEENQRKLVSAERMAAVGQSAACAAHELRNPLSAMKIWLYQLRSSAHDPVAVEQTCIVLEEEASRLEELATNFLQYSKPPELRMRRQRFHEIVDSTLAMGRHRFDEKRIRVVREQRNGTHLVMADGNQLRQVLLNLISNAAEATPEGGEVRITEAVEKDAEGREHVVLRIHDSGHGVDESMRDRLFEPFVTTKPRGTGLGLCVAASIVTRHGGRLELEAHDAPGAVFAVRLPACGD
jgi:signal transduction histidine kinase